MEGAQEGIIAKLRILSLDIVMATHDGADRLVARLSVLSLQCTGACMHTCFGLLKKLGVSNILKSSQTCRLASWQPQP